MTHPSEPDHAVLARFLAGEATRDDDAAVARWLAEDPRAAAELHAMRRLWEDAGAIPAPARVDAMWHELRRRMHADAAPVVARPTPRRPHHAPRLPLAAPARPRWRVPAALLAAGVAIAAAVTALGRDGAGALDRVAAADSVRTFTTARGQRATLRLGDGTRVELGYASVLKVRPFRGGRRELWLEGEAVFDVVHDSTRPFVVHAAHATTEDLGTTFGVRAYPGEPAVRVVVVSGLVAMRPRGADSASAARTGSGTVIRPGQMGRLDARGQLEVTRVDTAAWTAWLAGRVAFDNARLDEIAADLSRRFDVPITLADSALAARRLTVHVPGRSLADVLDAVTIPLGIAHRRSGGGVVLGR